MKVDILSLEQATKAYAALMQRNVCYTDGKPVLSHGAMIGILRNRGIEQVQIDGESVELVRIKL